MALILVADDDPRQLHLRRLLLETGGYEVSAALSVSGAVALAEAAPPDLVVTDLRFPDVNGVPDSTQGLALIRRLSQAAPGVPVIVLSGWPEDLDGAPEQRLVSRTFTKPFRSADLLQAVADLLSARPSVSSPAQSLPSVAP